MVVGLTRVITFMTLRSQPLDWCTRVRWFFFFFCLKKKRKKVLTSLDQVVFLSLLHFKREETADFFMSDADVPSCLTFYFVCILFIFKCFFLNVCNTVMMTWCHVEMSAVLFLYVCVQASKEIIKLKSSVYAYISSSSPKQELPPPFSLLLLLPRPALFLVKGLFAKPTPPPLSLPLSLSLAPLPPLSSKPGPTQIPILSFCHSSGLILSLPG